MYKPKSLHSIFKTALLKSPNDALIALQNGEFRNSNTCLQILFCLYEVAIQKSMKVEYFIELLKVFSDKSAAFMPGYNTAEAKKYYQCVYFIFNFLNEAGKFRELSVLGEMVVWQCSFPVINEAFYTSLYSHLMKWFNDSTGLSDADICSSIKFLLRIAEKVPGQTAASISTIHHALSRGSFSNEMRIKYLSLVVDMSEKEHKDHRVRCNTAVLNCLKSLLIKMVHQAAAASDYEDILSLAGRFRIRSLDAIIKRVNSLPNFRNSIANLLRQSDAELECCTSDLQLFTIAFISTAVFQDEFEDVIKRDGSDFAQVVELIFDARALRIQMCDCCNQETQFESLLSLLSVLTETNIRCLQFETSSQFVSMCARLTEMLMSARTARCRRFEGSWTNYCTLLVRYTLAAFRSGRCHREGVELLLRQVYRLGVIDTLMRKLSDVMCEVVKVFARDAQWDLCLLYIAMSLCLIGDYRHNLLKMWAHVQHKMCSADESLRVRPPCILSLLETESAPLGVVRHIDEPTRRRLIEAELEHYLQHYHSPDHISALLKYVHSRCGDDIMYVARLFVRVDDTRLLGLKKPDMFSIIRAIVKYISKSDAGIMARLFLPKMYYLQCLSEMEVDHESCMAALSNKSVKPLKPPAEQVLEPVPDKDDECEIHNTFENVVISKQISVMRKFRKVMAHLERALNPLRHHHVEFGANLYELSVQVAHCLHLYCDSLMNQRAWQLALRVARIMNDPVRIVEANGWLLRKQCDSKEARLMRDESHEIIKSIDVNSVQSQNVITQFHINLCSFYLVNKQYSAAQQAIREASRLYAECDEDNNGVLVQLKYFEVELLKLQCTYLDDALDDQHSAHMFPHAALEIVRMTLARKGLSRTPHLIIGLYIDIIEDALNFFYLLRLPRQMRYYGKSILQVCHQLVLPIRVQRLLTYLALADFLNDRLDDARDKYASIECIVGQPALTTNHESQGRIASTVLGSPSFSRPRPATDCAIATFVNDPGDCACYTCSTPEYLQLHMLRLYLDYSIAELEGDEQRASCSVQSATALFAFINDRAVFRAPRVVFPMVHCREVYGRLLLDDCNRQLMGGRDVAHLRELNARVLALAEAEADDITTWSQCNFLPYEVNHQRLIIEALSLANPDGDQHLPTTSKSLRGITRKYKLTSDVALMPSYPLRTPTNRVKKPSVPDIKVTMDMPRRVRVRRIVLSPSDCGDSVDNRISESVSAAVSTPKNKIFTSQQSRAGAAASCFTPLTGPKFKIFDEASAKKQRASTKTPRKKAELGMTATKSAVPHKLVLEKEEERQRVELRDRKMALLTEKLRLNLNVGSFRGDADGTEGGAAEATADLGETVRRSNRRRKL